MIWIGYTTLYRNGGAEIERSAQTLARQRRAEGAAVVIDRIESKRDFVRAVQACDAIDELHFLGHSGMYGPMFRTTAVPEQFSPHEWRELEIPFSACATATFHACRTGRWFAAFFANTFRIPAFGYHWYTTFSARRDRFVPPKRQGDLYLIGCKGKKSHGLLGSLAKYTGHALAEPLRRFDPVADSADDGSYDAVAELYAKVFTDIRVRRSEWRWLESHLPNGRLDVLDIGCGSGALLRQLAPRIKSGVGVDASQAMVAIAKRESADLACLRFERVDGPVLPLADNSVDLVTSLLSFRYLDWDPLMAEVVRVLRPGGRLLVVDMVTAPVTAADVPQLIGDKLKTWLSDRQNPRYRQARAQLVAHPGWAKMLSYNPIRAQHELVWYLESRFPGRKVERLNLGLNARVLAFDSGPIDAEWIAPQSYP